MDEKNNAFDFDFMPIGQAIKKAREARGMTREQLSGIIGYAPRHIQSIENEGKYPSIELFIQLITMFDVSVDEYIFPNKEVKKSSVRRRLDAQLDNLDDKELIAVISPKIIRAVLAVPTYIRVRGFGVMTDDKLVVPDSTAFDDFITAVYAFFFHFTPHSLAYLRYAFSPSARSRFTRAFPASSGYFACSLRRVLPTLSKLGKPRYLYCSITSAKGIAPAPFK